MAYCSLDNNFVALPWYRINHALDNSISKEIKKTQTISEPKIDLPQGS